MTNLADNLIRSALRHPARPAVRLDETVLSYGDLNDLASARPDGWPSAACSPVTGLD